MAQQDRPYDIVVFGASGFTGKYTCEHLVASAPTNLKWAIAGRSASKLKVIADELRQLNADRTPPAIEECSLQPEALKALTKKTKVLLTTVGPYAQFGTPALEACLATQTHYFDVTGETPWVYEMVKKHDEEAKKNKVIIIPQTGVDSVPADLLSWSLVTHIRRTLSKPTRNIFFSLHKLRSKPSGGTLASALGLLDSFSLSQIRTAMDPWSLSPIPKSSSYDTAGAPSLLTLLFGVRSVRDIGVVTTGLQGAVDRTQVYRSWGLMDSGKFYGEKFRFYPYATTRNMLQGMFVHFAIVFGGLALLISPLRAYLKKVVTAPGSGPSREASKHDFIEYKAIAEADSTDKSEPQRAVGSMRFEGSPYHLTGVFLAEAALSLLNDDSMAKEVGGGILTPAFLGSAYAERLQKAGVKIDTKIMPY